LPYVISGILLAVGIIVPLLVPLYARRDPELFGFPFFYWYQILWVFLEALLLWVVYNIVVREDRRRRRAVRGEPVDSRAQPPQAGQGRR
jgi:uncharacterized membrane protein